MASAKTTYTDFAFCPHPQSTFAHPEICSVSEFAHTLFFRQSTRECYHLQAKRLAYGGNWGVHQDQIHTYSARCKSSSSTQQLMASSI